MTSVQELHSVAGARRACETLGVPRASYYRWRCPLPKVSAPRRRSHRALSEAERSETLALLHSDRFVDQAPREICATLLDEDTYLCSPSTMYRLLKERQEIRERRNQLRHPQYQKPELLAIGPKQVWSWDITKLLGPEKWSYFYLYVLLDIYSRYVVAWLLAKAESGALAKRMIEEAIEKEEVEPGEIFIHSDNGPAMVSNTVAQLYANLGVTKSHSRPHVSNDNPFSEAQFKTLKYRPEFPKRFGSLEEARGHCREFFRWYNLEHRHSGIGFMTPASVHSNCHPALLARRQAVVLRAKEQHPERFVLGNPRLPRVPDEVWINPPLLRAKNEEIAH